MRKIEEKMLYACPKGKNWCSGNTRVVSFTSNDERPVSRVFLYGHELGEWFRDTGTFEVKISTLKTWPTVTTRSRLRALGVDVRQQDGHQILNGERIV